MVKKILFFILILVIFLSLFFVFFSGKESMEKHEVDDVQKANEVAVNFINDFLLTAPPSNDLGAKERALEYLSKRAFNNLDMEKLSRDLALFVGVQDIPDQGVDFKKVVIEDDGSASLVVEFKYSGVSTHRNIHLIKEDGEWKIDAVSTKDQLDFKEIGNIVRDNPGYPEGVWFLVYEEPGSPAVSKALLFTDESLCVKDEQKFICDPEGFENGERLEVEGLKEDNEVKVITLKHL